MRNKETDIRKYENEARVINILLKAVKAAKPIIDAWGDKQITKRLANKIEEVTDSNEINISYGSSAYARSIRKEIVFFAKNKNYDCGDHYAYVGHDRVAIIVNTENPSEGVENVDYAIKRLTNAKNEYEDAILNYDAYVAKNEAFKKAAKEYVEGMNHLLRLSAPEIGIY